MMLKLDLKQGAFQVWGTGQIGVPLPGIMESVELGGSLKMTDVPLEGQSGSKKVVDGWNDADLSIKLSLIDDPGQNRTRFDLLADIVFIFKRMDKAGKPEIINISHPLIDAWAVRQYIFSDLKTSEVRGRQKISVSLEFTEYKIVAALAQERKAEADRVTAETKAVTQQEASVSAVDARRLAAMERKLGYI
jgi:hypothetical protein